MELIAEDGVYCLIYENYRLSAELLPNGCLLTYINGHPPLTLQLSDTDSRTIKRLFQQLKDLLLGQAIKITTDVDPLSSMDRFRLAYKVLLSEAEGYIDSKLIGSLRYRLTEIERCLNRTSSKLQFR